MRLEARAWDEAVADLQEAIRLDGRRSDAPAALAEVFRRRGRPERAIEQYTLAIRLRPGCARRCTAAGPTSAWGASRTRPRSSASALRDLEEAIRLERPGDRVLARDHTNRARLLHRDRRDEEALAACDAALEADPDHLEAHLLRVGVLLELGRDEAVERSCGAALARSGRTPDVGAARGRRPSCMPCAGWPGPGAATTSAPSRTTPGPWSCDPTGRRCGPGAAGCS